MKSILDNKDPQFQSSEEGIKVKTLVPIDYIFADFIHARLNGELEEIGFTITYVFGIYKQDGSATINFTVRKKEGNS